MPSISLILSLDEILKCDHSLLRSTLLWCAFYYALQDGFEFEEMDKILKYDHSN